MSMSIRQIAEYVGQARNSNPRIFFTQMNGESGYGKSELAKYHNYAGIHTTEDDPHKVWISGDQAWGKTFDSDEDFAQYYAWYMGRWEVNNIQDWNTFVEKIFHGQSDGSAYAGETGYQHYLGWGGSSFATGYDEQEGYNGSIPTESPQQSDGLSSTEVDWSKLGHNHGGLDNPANFDSAGNRVTDVAGMHPETIHGLNKIGLDYGSLNPILTGGTEKGYHASGTYSHENGWKADIVMYGVTGGTEAGKKFKAYCNNNGWSANWEGDHWDIDFSGHDSRDPQSGDTTLKAEGFFSSTVPYAGDNEGRWSQAYPVEHVDYFGQPQTQQPVSFWDMMASNAIDTLSSLWVGDSAVRLWGTMYHTADLSYKPLTQDDYDYVTTALAGDKDAQRFVLLNGHDTQNIKWLVQQRLAEKERQRKVAQWRANNDSMILSGLSYLAGAVPYLADPINYIPFGTALNGAKIAGRLGAGLLNAEKAGMIARFAAQHQIMSGALRGGVEGATAVTASNVLSNQIGERSHDYASDAALAFVGGAILGGVSRGIGTFMSKNNTPRGNKIVKEAENVETQAIRRAADLSDEEIQRIGSETYVKAYETATHYVDPEVMPKLNAQKLYSALSEKNKVVAMPFKEANKLMRDFKGIDLPKDVKAFYVPNENYAIVLADRVKPEEVDRILAHEFAIHAGLKETLGTSRYSQLMAQITKEADKKGTIWNEARTRSGEYDPEEILAQVIEDDKLPDSMWSKIQSGMNKYFKKNGAPNLSRDEVKEILQKQLQGRKTPDVFYVNPDGSTAFAGIKFSKDNLFNPENLATTYDTVKAVRNDAERDLPSALRWVADKAEQGILGRAITSVSPVLRKYGSKLWEDARGRGLGEVDTMPADSYKKFFINQLKKPFTEEYLPARSEWARQHGDLNPRTAFLTYDRQVLSYYNGVYGRHKAMFNPDVDPEIIKGAEALKKWRDRMLELGQDSARLMGNPKGKNMINPDFYAVDGEFNRWTDNHAVARFIDNFVGTHEETAQQQIEKFLNEYADKYVLRDVIEEEIIRGKRMANAKKKRANDKMEAKVGKDNKDYKPQELEKEVATEEEIDTWIKEHKQHWVNSILHGHYDISDPKGASKLGDLSFLRQRFPLDTSGVMKLPNGKDFSFDNNLAFYDMDTIVLKTTERFSGETALSGVFKDDAHLQKVTNLIDKQVHAASTRGEINKGTADNSVKEWQQAINELRGLRSNDEAAMGRLGAIARIFRNLSYVKNGINMGFNQIGELAGSIIYGGASQLFSILPNIRVRGHDFNIANWIEDIRRGKVSSETLRDVENQLYGQSLESKIWSMNYQDRVVHDALTQDSVVDSFLRSSADLTHNLGKVTSTLNMLPKTTDAMERGMRIQTIVDSLNWARGKKFSAIRNPFSKAKLKAARVSEKEAEDIKNALNKYFTFDKEGRLVKGDVESWQLEDAHSFFKWYNLIQLQQERAIVTASRQGNKNLLKNSSAPMQMLFQFKDYSLRAINAQFMRTLTAREADDILSAAFGLVWSLVPWTARVGLTYGSYQALGMDKKAQEYWDKMMSQDMLMKVVATRSTILGTPVSFGNDVYEAIAGSTSVRTSVDRTQSKQNWRERDPSEAVGDFVSQLPAVKEGLTAPYLLYHNYNRYQQGKPMTQRDWKDLWRLMPFEQFIPFSALADWGGQDLPESNSKKKKK